MSDSASRAELIIELQDIRGGGAAVPLEYAEKELASLPVDELIGFIIRAAKVELDVDAIADVSAGMQNAAEDTSARLTVALEGSESDAARLAELNIQSVADHAARMASHGIDAQRALTAMYHALTTALVEARAAKSSIDAARLEAEQALSARSQFAETIDGYIESM